MAGFLLCRHCRRAPATLSHRGRGWDLVSLVGWPLAFLWRYVRLATRSCAAAAFSCALRGCVLWAGLQPILPQALRSADGRDVLLVLPHPTCSPITLVFKATRHLIVFDDFLANYLALQVAAMVVPRSALFGTLYYVAVERPCMDPQWPRKAWSVAGPEPDQRFGVGPAVEHRQIRRHDVPSRKLCIGSKVFAL